MYVSKGFSRHVAVVPEDNNVTEFSSVEDFKQKLIHRARCVMGFRGVRGWETTPVNGNAVQHGVRMVCSGHVGAFAVDEHIVAEYARHVADETIYWRADPHYRMVVEGNM